MTATPFLARSRNSSGQLLHSGCPPRPEAIIWGVAVAAGLVDKKTGPVEFKQTSDFPIPRYHPEDLKGAGDLVIYEKMQNI